MDTKELIDQKYSHPAMRKLMYWKLGDHPECAAEIGDEFTAGNQDFADHVCMLMDYTSSLEDRLARIEKQIEVLSSRTAGQMMVGPGDITAVSPVAELLANWPELKPLETK